MKHLNLPKDLLFGPIIIGVLSGLAATAFHYFADNFGELLFSWVESNSPPVRLPLVLVVPTVGLFLVGLALQLYPPSRLGGVREVSESISQHGGIIDLNRIMNVILSGLVLAFGGSVGPEGPMVQMGALIGSQVGRRLVPRPETMRLMVRAGAAAGIAGAFRSPAGGIVLALEVFGARLDTELPAIGVAAVIGYLTRTVILGREYAFALGYQPDQVTLTALFLIAPLMGLVAAPTGHLFIRLLTFLRTSFPQRWPLSLRVAFGGFLVGAIGIFYPQVMSAGYAVVVSALRGRIGVNLFIILLLLKILATCITFGSGAVGGLFAPTLFIGAMFGGAFGFGFHALFPTVVPQPEVFVLLGMVVMFGSIIKGYWSGLLLVADMSGCYHTLLLPGIIAGGISFLVSWRLHDKSVFELPLAAEQIDVVEGKSEKNGRPQESVAPQVLPMAAPAGNKPEL
jgi:CIC family chloride channel protein